MMQRLLMAGALALSAVPALAQDKNSGPLLSPYQSPVARPVAPPAPRPTVGAPGQSNPQVQQEVSSLPLDPATRDMRDSRPADVAGAERRLGLREPRGPRTDFRGRTPSSREIVDALAPRR